MRRALLVGAMILPVSLARPARAQRLQPEVRADVLGPAPYAVQGGLGVIVPLGYYVRASVGAAEGARRVAGRWENSARFEILARAVVDPFREQRWGLSLGGGLALRTNWRGENRAYLAFVADLEGPALGAVTPAVQVGVSGGLRAGLVLRRTMPGRR